ncbi:hypothetical protein BDN67DRAFT_50370 [Paxillus ammoniavirescens]|nr:hypothetical protein BDN67DRAFT_50370 [Paxillus ammoniavirescens]
MIPALQGSLPGVKSVREFSESFEAWHFHLTKPSNPLRRMIRMIFPAWMTMGKCATRTLRHDHSEGGCRHICGVGISALMACFQLVRIRGETGDALGGCGCAQGKTTRSCATARPKELTRS